MTFKINIGNWTEYRPDGSLDLPDSDRLAYPWIATSAETYHVSYFADAGTYPNTAASPYGTWLAVTAGTFTTSLPADAGATNGTALDIDTPTDLVDCHCYFTHNYAGSEWVDNINNADGYVIKAKLKTVDGGATATQYLWWVDGTYQIRFTIYQALVGFGAGYIAASAVTYTMDTSDAFHTYEARVFGTDVKLYIDDVLCISGNAISASTAKEISWGDLYDVVNAGGSVLWDYIRYKTTREIFGGVIETTSSNVPSGYCLDLDGSVDVRDNLYYFQNTDVSPFFTDVDNTRGHTVEAQIKVIDSGAGTGQSIRISDGTYETRLDFTTSEITVNSAFIAEAGTTYSMDTTDDFHIYRITIQETSFKVYVDNIERMSLTLDATADARELQFGDTFTTATYGGRCLWGYVKYRMDGVYPPNELTSNGWVYSNFDVVDKRRVKKHPIIRSDNSIIPEGKAQPTKVKVKGTVNGSCYDSFRDTVRRLKRMLHDGEQTIYLDETQYIKGINTGFTLNPKTQSFANYAVPFDCQYPYWQQAHGSYLSTSPVHATTFNIYNDSDVDIPLRIIITGAATGTVTNFTLQNVTADQECKYSGSLTATQELFIDSGFYEYNTLSVEIGTGNYFNSYSGDFLTLKPGRNAIMFSSNADGVNVGTLEFYWRKSFLL